MSLAYFKLSALREWEDEGEEDEEDGAGWASAEGRVVERLRVPEERNKDLAALGRIAASMAA